MRRIARAIDLYCTLFRAGLRAKLNYRADVLVMVPSFLLIQAIGYVFLWVVFRQLPTIAGWSMHELVCVYAMISITEGIVGVFGEGLWALSWLKFHGAFDALLMRPVSPLLQVLLTSVGLHGFGPILLGSVMIARSLEHITIDWTPGRIAMAVALFLSAAIARLGTMLAASATAFWIETPFNPTINIVHSSSYFARFPLTIYGQALNFALTFLVPWGFVSYYPVAWVFGKADVGWIGLFTPLVAVAAFGFAAWLFRRGLARYESAGG